MMVLDDIDRRLVIATQAGLPLVPQPYAVLGEQLGIPAAEIIARMEKLLAAGIIRRIGAVPNHYALGYRFNGMTVWDVADEDMAAAGAEVAALPFVSHCYHRPRFPDWPYSLFAMIHAKESADADALVQAIAQVLGARDRGHLVLFSTRILKKTGLRLAG
jgi:siroheme decarboxylase